MLKLGSHGPEVTQWQQALIARGYSVGAPDDHFGKRTHNATCAFQAAVGLPVTGEVGGDDWQMMKLPGAVSIRPPPILPQAIPYVPSRFAGRNVVRKHVNRICLHCMEAPEASTRAERCADTMATLPPDSKKKSAHFYGDSDTVVQGVLVHHIAYGCPGLNHNAIHIEHAGYARQSREEWLDEFGRRMLWLTAQLCARWCHQLNIPIVFLRAVDLPDGSLGGITTHHEGTLAFGLSDHHDPGPGFPMDWYLEQVHLAYDSQAGIV